MYKSYAEAVREWLTAYRRDEDGIDERIEQIRALRERVMSVGAQVITDMPRAPSVSGDSMTEYIIRLEALEAGLSREEKQHEMDRRIIVDLSSRLRKRDERQIIRERYLNGRDWSDVLMEVYRYEEGFSAMREAYRRRMYRAHESALEQLGKMWGTKSNPV